MHFTHRRANREEFLVVLEFLTQTIHRPTQHQRRVKKQWRHISCFLSFNFSLWGSQLSSISLEWWAEREGRTTTWEIKTPLLSSAQTWKWQGHTFFVDTSAVTSPWACEPWREHNCHHHHTGQVELTLRTRLREAHTPQQQPLLFHSWG